MFAIVDCNNFYASCERLFRPDLWNKPVVVLSNNDGCVIARSNEAKVLGIKMGEPYFKIKALCQRHHIAVFSSNYSLYGDLSARVMSTIAQLWPAFEVYSIDEAFLNLHTLAHQDHTSFCHTLHQTILKHIGIPTSIGIAPTKTLAKAANYLAKRVFSRPVVHLEPDSDWLRQIPVEEIWGVGRKWAQQLQAMGIYSARDLSLMHPTWTGKKFNIVLQRTVMELQGISCQDLAEPTPRKSIVVSRSFGCLQTEYHAIAEALTDHCHRAYDKLRQHNLKAQSVTVFIQTNRYRQDLTQYFNHASIELVYPTDELIPIIKSAKRCLRAIFKEQLAYNKVGIELSHLASSDTTQLDLFTPEPHHPAQEALYETFDRINQKYGRHTIHLLAKGLDPQWSMRQQHRSPRYTTQWNELKKV